MYIRLNIWLLVLLHLHSSSASYDVDEVRNVLYEPEFATTIAGVDPSVNLNALTAETLDDFKKRLLRDFPKEDDPSYLYMTSSSGQRFACSLPKIVKSDDEQAESYNPRYLSEIIGASFYLKDCIQLDNGWWKYEVCRGKTVRQFHGAKNEADQTEYSLGMFTGTYDMPDFTKSTSDRVLYVEELYEGGSLCDVTDIKIPRKTRVRYECDPLLPTSEAYILQVEEASSCEYVIRVKVGALCKLKPFAPPNQSNGLQITCQPYISVERINKYLQGIIDQKAVKLAAERVTDELRDRMTSVTRRKYAMRRTELMRDPLAKRLATRKRLTDEFVDISNRFFIAAYIAQNGKNPSNEQVKMLSRLTSMLDGDAMTRHEYPSDFDLEQGSLWFYFNDPNWDKRDFPKSLNYVDILNEYYARAVKKASLKSLSPVEKVELFKKIRGDPYNPDENVLITKQQIARELVNMFSSPFNNLDEVLFDLDEDDEYSSSPIWISRTGWNKHFDEYVNSIVPTFFASAQSDLANGYKRSARELLHMISDQLAPVYMFTKLVTAEDPLSVATFESMMDGVATLMDKLIISYKFVEGSLVDSMSSDQIPSASPVPDVQSKAEIEKEFEEFHANVLRSREKAVHEALMNEYKQDLLAAMNASYLEAFDKIWYALSEKLLNDARDKVDARNWRDSAFDLFGEFSVSSGSGDEQLPSVSGADLVEMLTSAGIGKTNVKIEVANLDGLAGTLNKEELEELVAAQMEELRAIQKVGDREKAYKTLLVDADEEEEEL